jgi:Flp pilus assembly pilin Flp
MISRIRQFLACEDAPTAAEYAVMLVFVVPVIIIAVSSVGNATSGLFSSANSAFGGGS